MRASVTIEMRRYDRTQPWAALWDDCLWFLQECEQLGFDTLLIQEHFFTEDGYAPSMPVFLTALIDRTSTARVGSYISIAPLHHPAHLAQEMAVLDHYSGGRLEVGVGNGHRAAEYLAFGMSPKSRPSRMEEAIEVMRKAWTGEPFDHEGRYHRLSNLQVTPEPLQKPHPPLWMAATTPAPAERAGRLGLNLAGASADPAVARAWREALEAHGHDPATMRISNPWSVTVTDEDPEAVWRRHADKYFFRWDFYRKIRAELGDPDLLYGEPAADDYRQNEMIGSADQVLSTLRPLVEQLGLTDIVFNAPAPGIDLRTEGYESFAKLAQEVLPEIRRW